MRTSAASSIVDQEILFGIFRVDLMKSWMEGWADVSEKVVPGAPEVSSMTGTVERHLQALHLQVDAPEVRVVDFVELQDLCYKAGRHCAELQEEAPEEP